MDIETSTGHLNVESRRLRMQPVGMALDHPRRLISYAHSQLGAASWRMPRLPPRHVRTSWGVATVRASLSRQRRVLRLLADGATTRQVAAKVRMSLRDVGAIKKAALEWRDPDDE
jgi:hypothetical protein